MNRKDLMELKRKFVLEDHVLTDDQLEQLIEEKLIRAREYREVLRKREQRVPQEFE